MARRVRCDFGVDACVIRLLENNEIVLLASAGIPKTSLYSRLPADFGLAKSVFSRRQPIFVPEVKPPPDVLRAPRGRHPYQFASYAGAPLVARGRVIGLLALYWKRKTGAFGDADMECLQIVGNSIAAAITENRLCQAMRSQKEQLESQTEKRRKAEGALRESESRFRALFDSTFQFVGLLSPEGVLLEANQTALDAAGLNLNDVLNRPFWECRWWTLSPDTRRQLKAAIARAARGEFVHYEVDLRGVGDRVIPADFSLKPLMDATGKVKLIIPEARDITGRREAERALRESEAKYRALVETTATGFVIVDSEGRVLDANAEYVRLTGHDSLRDILGRSVIEWTAPHDAARNAQAVRDCVASGSVRNLEVDYVDGKGRLTPIEINATVLRAGDSSRTVALCRDISDRKRAEQALRESEERFRAIADYTVNWESWVGADGRFLWVNPGAERVTGYTPAECMAMAGFPLPIVHEDDRARMAEAFQGAVRGTSGIDLVFRIRRKDRRVIWASVSWQPVFDAAGRLLGHRSSISDITARKLAEEAQSRLAAMLAATPDFVGFARAKDLHIFYINRAGRRMIGIGDDEDLTSLKTRDVHPAWMHRLLVQEAFPTAAREGVWRGEAALLSRDGREIPILMVLLAHKSPGGEVDVFSTISHDISDRKQAEEERERLNARLREAQKLEALGRFGRGVAHDFNNLMATVLGLASNMRLKRPPDHPDYLKLTNIEEAAETASKLAHQLLAFAKGGKIHPQVLPLGDVVRSALALVPPMVPENVSLDCHLKPGTWRIECDQTQIQQVVINLCRNAVEAMPNGGRLTIRVATFTLTAPLLEAQPSLPTGDYACLSVEDTGRGMDAETIKRIFEPFFTTKPQGHGLGLAAAYGIVAAHGGAVSVSSEPGTGSTFHIWLPRAKRSR